jgi:hypothetical protein
MRNILLLLAFAAACSSSAHGQSPDAKQTIDAGLPATVCTHVQDATSSCCERDDDCSSAMFQTCAPAGAAQGCGICTVPTNPCHADSDCAGSGSNMICTQVACDCDNAMECTPGCTAATDCGDGQTCDLSTSRCAPTACTGSGAGACPADFECKRGHCSRLSCTTDADCDGYCVEGACYSTAGECRSPVV